MQNQFDVQNAIESINQHCLKLILKSNAEEKKKTKALRLLKLEK